MASNPQKDGYDWPFIIYAGTVILRRTEDDVWNMTPRKLYALLKVHSELNDINGKTGTAGQNTKDGFIDSIPGW